MWPLCANAVQEAWRCRFFLESVRGKSEVFTTIRKRHSKTSHQTQTKTTARWKIRHIMTYLRSFVTCPPCRRNYFCGACRMDGSILRSKDFANTQTLQPSASTKNRHWSRAGSPESRQASQMSFREYGKLSLHQARTCENIAHAHAK